MHGERGRKQPEGLDRDVHLQGADGAPRVVAETDAPGHFLEIRAERRPDFFERRLERRKQARARAQRTDHQVDRGRELRLDRVGLLPTDMLFHELSEHAREEAARDGNRQRDAGHRP